MPRKTPRKTPPKTEIVLYLPRDFFAAKTPLKVAR